MSSEPSDEEQSHADSNSSDSDSDSEQSKADISSITQDWHKQHKEDGVGLDEAELCDDDGQYIGLQSFDLDDESNSHAHQYQRQLMSCLASCQYFDVVEEPDIGCVGPVAGGGFCPNYLFGLATFMTTMNPREEEDECTRASRCRGAPMAPDGHSTELYRCSHLWHSGMPPRSLLTAMSVASFGGSDADIDSIKSMAYEQGREDGRSETASLAPTISSASTASSALSSLSSKRSRSDGSSTTGGSSTNSARSLAHEAARARNVANLTAIEEAFPELCARHLYYNCGGRAPEHKKNGKLVCDRADCAMPHEEPDGFIAWAKANIIS